MGKTVFAVLLGVISMTIVHSAYPRDYDVEIIIFEPEPEPMVDAGSDVSGEIWNFSPAHISPRLERIENLSSRADEYKTRPVLDRLESIRKDLVESGYHILKTAKWTQPPLVYRKAPLVSLGIKYTSLPHGYVRIYKTSLLFADLDIQLSPLITPVPDSFSDYLPGTDQKRLPRQQENYSPHYFLSEKRRLKFKEVHYFDHPKFGAIIGVWPIN